MFRFAPHDRRDAATVATGLLIVAVVLIPGCSKMRFRKSPWLVTQRDAARYLEQALDHPSADVRRDALERLSETRFVAHETVLEACDIVARTDSSESVRCAAVRLLAGSRHPDVAETFLAILGNGGGGRHDERSEASRRGSEVPEILRFAQNDVGRRTETQERVRLDAVRALYFLVRNDAVSQEQRDGVVAVAVRLLREERSRDLRIAAAMLLGEIPHTEALKALIAGLNHTDFGVVYHAERSLMRLTGVTNNHDSTAWRTWLASADAPFAMRGRLDSRLESQDAVTERHWWQRLTRSVRRALGHSERSEESPQRGISATP